MTSGHVMTLANSVIGVAILSMPFCFQKCGILLAIVLLLAINATTRVCCHYLIKASILSRRRSMETIALYVFGASGKLMVELCTIGYLMGTCVAYFVVVGDLGPQIISKMLDVPHTEQLRVWIMLLVTVVCVVPLGLLKNVDSLSAVSTASIGFYFCLVVKVMAESRDQLWEGRWWDEVHFWRWSGVLQCVPIFCLSLSCQIVIFEVYESVAQPSLSRMNAIVQSAISMVTGVYVAVGFFGYVAFFDRPFTGNILLSLEPSPTSDIIQMGFVLSVACSFPLVIFPCRASLYSLLYQRDHSDVVHYIPEHRYRLITLAIIVPALIVGILTPSVELIIGMVGSTIGVAICIMFPATIIIRLGKRDSAELLLAKFLLVFGFGLMVLGTYANLEAFEDRTSGMQSELLSEEHVHNPVEVPAAIVRPPAIVAQPAAVDLVVDAVRIGLAPAAVVSDEMVPKIDAALIDEAVVKKPEESKLIDTIKTPPPAPEPEISRDAIAHEEQEIAIEEKQTIDKKLDELKETKALVEQIKVELAKQNEKTQQLVREKLDEIADKVEHIEKVQEEEAAAAKTKAEVPKNAVEAPAPDKPNAIEISPAAIDPKPKVAEPVHQALKKFVRTDDPIVNLIQKSAKAKIETRSVDVANRTAANVSDQTEAAAVVTSKVQPVAAAVVGRSNQTSNASDETLGDRVARDLLSLPSGAD